MTDLKLVLIVFQMKKLSEIFPGIFLFGKIFFSWSEQKSENLIKSFSKYQKKLNHKKMLIIQMNETHIKIKRKKITKYDNSNKHEKTS